MDMDSDSVRTQHNPDQTFRGPDRHAQQPQARIGGAARSDSRTGLDEMRRLEDQTGLGLVEIGSEISSSGKNGAQQRAGLSQKSRQAGASWGQAGGVRLCEQRLEAQHNQRLSCAPDLVAECAA